MKSVFISILALFLIFAAAINSYAALRIDGFDNDLEWEYAEYINPIFSPDSNNVGFALLKYYFDSNGYDAYFMLYLSDKKSESLDKCGFILNINDGVEITVTTDKVTSVCNASLFNVSAQMNSLGSDGYCCEIKVSFKKGLPDTVSGTVSYIDGTGNNSYFYPFSFIYKDFAINESHTYESTERTTQERTTKERTTKPKITSEPKTIKEITTEKIRTSAAKRTENKTVVYFYEKEVYISEVYITDKASVSENVLPEESTTAPAIIETSQRSFQIADGVAIQKVVCAVGGVIFIALAAWVGLSAKKKPKENPETQKEDDK